jgi:alkanesulfonate monooxygenase SsuD/methylene tetrahydromethanopterin reductase-like flavin-dependent oxidoreductase (luciferase family)
MKIGILQFFSWPDRRFPLDQVYSRALQRIEIMDQTGYDSVWLAEHHFNTYSVCPSVHVMGTMVAARTKHMRIGMGVTLAAFYHPLRIAEEVALLDILSGGRVNWGAGRGFDNTEYRVFDVTHDTVYPRFRENFEIVQQAWSQDRLTYKGEFWDFDNIEVLPKPMQKPMPPVWIAATSPSSIEWAAERGYNIMLDPHSTHQDIWKKRQLYASELTRHGFSAEGREVPTVRFVAVGNTEAEAAEIARGGAAWTVGEYANPGNRAARSNIPEGVDPVERYMNDIVIYGTPEQVADKFIELRETEGLNYVLCGIFRHSSFLLFTEKVLPRLL